MWLNFLVVVVLATVPNTKALSKLPRITQRTSLGDAIDKATFKMLQEAFVSNDDVVTSPLSIMMLLSLFNAGAGEESRQQINELLGGEDYQQLTESYSSLSRMFSELNPDYLTIANKMYVDDRFNLSEIFADNARNYRSEVEKINFVESKEATDIINKWAESKTGGHIKKAVEDDVLNANTMAALFNIIFFQGHWHVPFQASDTTDKDFYVAEGNIVKKPMMHLRESIKYTECSDIPARMIELPYKEEGFRMIVVLPNEINGLPAVVEQAAKTGLRDDIFRLYDPFMSGRDVILDMPKFDIETSLDLKDILSKVGVSAIFSEPALGIVEEDTVKVETAFQKAFVKVDEEGAVAGAFTGAVMTFRSYTWRPPAPIVFKVDHPFLFLILHEDKTLFAGTLSH